MSKILTQEWFASLPEDRQEKLRKESADLNDKVLEIIRIASDGNILQEALMLRAIESYMQDVHASILCGFGAEFFSIVIMIATSMLRTVEEERLFAGFPDAPTTNSTSLN